MVLTRKLERGLAYEAPPDGLVYHQVPTALYATTRHARAVASIGLAGFLALLGYLVNRWCNFIFHGLEVGLQASNRPSAYSVAQEEKRPQERQIRCNHNQGTHATTFLLTCLDLDSPQARRRSATS